MTPSGDPLNALIHRDERAPAGRGPLAGWTLAVKANIEVAGLPATAGTAALSGWVPETDAPLVARLRAAGATIGAIANMHELAFGATNAASVHGPVRNPRDPDGAAGGSSGGSAAAVVAGLVDAAIGTDTGGSCCIPAALCGCVGLRPTTGRYPSAGMVSLSPTRDTAGPLTRSVADARLLDAVMAGDETDAAPVAVDGLRLGVPRRPFFHDLDAGLAAVIETALQRLADAGAVLVDVDLSEVEEVNARCALQIVLYEAPLMRNTDAPSTAGLPCLSIPAGDTAAGLPVGLELVGPAGTDRRLLRIGEAAEAVLSCA